MYIRTYILYMYVQYMFVYTCIMHTCKIIHMYMYMYIHVHIYIVVCTYMYGHCVVHIHVCTYMSFHNEVKPRPLDTPTGRSHWLCMCSRRTKTCWTGLSSTPVLELSPITTHSSIIHVCTCMYITVIYMYL